MLEKKYESQREFMRSIGRKVGSPRQVCLDDVVGICFNNNGDDLVHDIRLYSVDSHHLYPTFDFGDYLPFVKLSDAYFAFKVENDSEPLENGYFNLEPKNNSNNGIWMPPIVDKTLPLEKQEIQEQYIDETFSQNYLKREGSKEVYVIEDPMYQNLGIVLPDVKVKNNTRFTDLLLSQYSKQIKG